MNNTGENKAFENEYLISFIIPAYNISDWLERCVRSIFCLGQLNFEVLIIENGSTDDTLKTAAGLSEEYKTVRVLQSEKGVSYARNKGISEAKGKYICFVDADDFLLDNGVGLLMEDAEKAASDLYCYSYYKGNDTVYVNNNDVLYERDSKEQCIVRMLENPTLYMTCWAKLFRRSLITEKQICFAEDLAVSEDSLFVLQYLLNCSSVILSDKICYSYQRQSGSTMRTYTGDKSDQYLKALDRAYQYIGEESVRIREAFTKYVIAHLNLICVREIYSTGSSLSHREQRVLLKQLVSQPLMGKALKNISLKNGLSVRILPGWLLKYKVYFLAETVFRIRVLQNNGKETMK